MSACCHLYDVGNVLQMSILYSKMHGLKAKWKEKKTGKRKINTKYVSNLNEIHYNTNNSAENDERDEKKANNGAHSNEKSHSIHYVQLYYVSQNMMVCIERIKIKKATNPIDVRNVF